MRDTAAGKDERTNTSIHVSRDASPLYPLHEQQQQKKVGAVADEWFAGEEQSRVSLKALREENDYFLAKWSWSGLHVHVTDLDGTLKRT